MWLINIKSRVGFDLSVEVNEVNLSLYYGGVIGILVQLGVLTLSPDVFAWCVTFVSPINSAVINP